MSKVLKDSFNQYQRLEKQLEQKVINLEEVKASFVLETAIEKKTTIWGEKHVGKQWII